ncbi:beta strand repeat-containing protein [Deinococcus pimensis]|uniref:beta strand repeat-containing protein n=1 Tax=Deinococcus pimensis TaxID=309888 RepID=UPI0004885BE6|nr:IPT/TIG domain-containing protein [Deinococcus pimensis]
MPTRTRNNTLTALLSASLLVACGTSTPTPPPSDPTPIVTPTTTPTITGLTSTAALPGSTVTITGADLPQTLTVTIGGINAAISARTTTSVTLTVPTTLSGPQSVSVIIEGKTYQLTQSLFVGKALTADITTTTALQAELDALPTGAAVLLPAVTLTAGDAPLLVTNHSLYGTDGTLIEGDVTFIVREGHDVTVDTVAFKGDSFVVAHTTTTPAPSIILLPMPPLSAPTISTQRALATTGPALDITATGTLPTTTNATTAGSIRAQTTTIERNGTVNFNRVEFNAKTEGAGSFIDRAQTADFHLTDTHINLASVSVGSYNGVTTSDSVRTIDVLGTTITANNIRLMSGQGEGTTVANSTLVARDSLLIGDSTTAPVTVDASTVRATNGDVLIGGIDTVTPFEGGTVTVRGSTVEAFDDANINGQSTPTIIITGRGDVDVQDNLRIHADDDVSIFSLPFYKGQPMGPTSSLSMSAMSTPQGASTSTGAVTMTGNHEITAGDGPDDVKNTGGSVDHNYRGEVVALTFSGALAVQDNTLISGDGTVALQTASGDVTVTGNRLRSVGPTGSGTLSVSSSGPMLPGKVMTFTANTVDTSSAVALFLDIGDLTVDGNTVNVTSATSNTSFGMNVSSPTSVSFKGNNVNVSTPEDAATINLSFGSSSRTFDFGRAAANTVLENNKLTVNSHAADAGSTSLGVTSDYAALTASGNTFTSSGRVALTANRGATTYSGNTFSVGAVTDALSLTANLDERAAPLDSALTFTGNAVTGVADEADVKVVDGDGADASKAVVTLSDNTYKAN